MIMVMGQGMLPRGWKQITGQFLFKTKSTSVISDTTDKHNLFKKRDSTCIANVKTDRLFLYQLNFWVYRKVDFLQQTFQLDKHFSFSNCFRKGVCNKRTSNEMFIRLANLVTFYQTYNIEMTGSSLLQRL